MKPLVSVVTPVYNEEKHLGQCIESVLAQTYQHWDYTILDNCSADASVEIARRYAAREPRIRVVHNKDFLPVLQNHNAALRLISSDSKYCKMVFADDWIFPECLERMVSVAEDHPTVGIVGAYGIQGSKVLWAGLPYPSSRVSGRTVGRLHFLDPLYELGSASSLLFRSDLVRKNDPFYNELNLHGDIEALLVRLKDSDFSFVHQILCFSRERLESISSAASEMSTYKGALLHCLIAHGPAYLSAEEFEGCLERALDDYYNFLVVNVVFGQGAMFWEYHKTILDGVGLGFSRARLARALVIRLCRAVLNPMETLKKLLEKRKVKLSRGKKSAKSSEIAAVLRHGGRS